VQRAAHDEPDEPDPGETKIRPKTTRIAAPATGRDHSDDRADGKRHVGSSRHGIRREVDDRRTAHHDAWHRIEHVAEPVVRERNRAGDSAVGGERDEIDGHRGHILVPAGRVAPQPVRPSGP